MNGLTDKQQAELVIASSVLIVVGLSSIPAGAPWIVGVIISLCGAIGLGIKDALGTTIKKQ